MEWLQNLIIVHSTVQAIVVLSLVCVLGLTLGKIKIANVSLKKNRSAHIFYGLQYSDSL